MRPGETVAEVPEVTSSDCLKLATRVASVRCTNALATHVVWCRLSGQVGIALSEADLASMLKRKALLPFLHEGYLVVDLRAIDTKRPFAAELDQLKWLYPADEKPESPFPDCF